MGQYSYYKSGAAQVSRVIEMFLREDWTLFKLCDYLNLCFR